VLSLVPTSHAQSNGLSAEVLSAALQHLRRTKEYLLYKKDVEDVALLLLQYAPRELTNSVSWPPLELHSRHMVRSLNGAWLRSNADGSNRPHDVGFSGPQHQRPEHRLRFDTQLLHLCGYLPLHARRPRVHPRQDAAHPAPDPLLRLSTGKDAGDAHRGQRGCH
jgi:hypothetical protein